MTAPILLGAFFPPLFEYYGDRRVLLKNMDRYVEILLKKEWNIVKQSGHHFKTIFED